MPPLLPCFIPEQPSQRIFSLFHLFSRTARQLMTGCRAAMPAASIFIFKFYKPLRFCI